MAGWLDNLFKTLKRTKPLADALPEMLDPGDPRVVIRPFGDDWLCPYTGLRVMAPDWNGSSLTLLQTPEIRDHLLAQPMLQEKSLEAPMKTFEELVSICVFQRIQAGGNYKFAAREGEWVCPYCLTKTETLLRNWDGSEVEFKFYFQQVLKHFAGCPEYQEDPIGGAKVVEEIKEAGGDRAKLWRYLKSDPRFKVIGPDGAWLDPFAARTVAKLNLKREPWGEAIQGKILDYLLSNECPGKYSNFEVEKSLAELQQAAVTKTQSY